MLEFSYFTGFYDNKPQPCSCDSWVDFVERMRAISEVEGYKPAAGDYENAQALISPAIYKEYGVKRSNDNVLGWDILMMDIDDTNLSLSEITKKFEYFDNIIYSSPSCTKHKLKLRVVLHLDERCPTENLNGLFYAAQMWCQGLIDEQTKDKSRLYYIPARYTNKGEDYLHFFKVNSGKKLDWKAMMAKYPMPPEAERFKKNNPLRKLKRSIFVDNNPLPDLNIQSPDCPFVTDQMINDYMLTPSGGHHTAIYKFMVQICYRARDANYPIDVEELADMGKQLDDLDGGFYEQKKMMNNAVDAMAFVGI